MVYIGGYGRSGSTLLDRLFDRIPGTIGLGEAANLFLEWRRGAAARCSCGQQLGACPFWASVLEAVRPVAERYGGAEAVDRAVRRVERSSRLWLPLSRPIEIYRDVWSTVIDAVYGQAGAGAILVDSSKSTRLTAGRPLALRAALGVDVFFIHLVRDARGVLYSSLRGSNRALESGAVRLPPFTATRSMASLLAANAAARMVAAKLPAGRARVLHYEDMVREPDTVMEALAAWLGAASPLAAAPAFAGHRFSGNRGRLAGAVKVQADEAWRSRLAPHHFALGTLVERCVSAVLPRP